MKRDNDRQTAIILSIVGIVPVIWLALLIAPSISGGLPEIAANLATLFDNPFSIKLCGDSLKTVLILLLCYGMGIGIYFSTRKNYRRREEHGSAKWGNVRAIDKKYRQKPLSENKLMTQNVCIGLNAKKHRRNLNTLVCGGSGAGKTRFYAKQTNVDTNNRLICYDILDLGKQLMPIGMLVVLDSILNRITQNRAKGKNTFIFIDEIYLLFQHEYSANFLFTLWKRVRKYGAYASGITQNVDDLLQSHTARTMLANSEFIIMLNQASTDRLELAKLLNISDLQMSYITNVEAGHGLIMVGSSLVPFANKFPKNTKLYKLMTTKPGEA